MIFYWWCQKTALVWQEAKAAAAALWWRNLWWSCAGQVSVNTLADFLKTNGCHHSFVPEKANRKRVQNIHPKWLVWPLLLNYPLFASTWPLLPLVEVTLNVLGIQCTSLVVDAPTKVRGCKKSKQVPLVPATVPGPKQTSRRGGVEI